MKKRLIHWLNNESKVFSIMCGERFTNKEVLMMHGVLLIMAIGVGIAGAIGV